MNLMVVEDEIRLQYNLAYNIPWEDHDIEVVGTAKSGEEALSLIELRRPDILILDIEMPNMDGLSLMKIVKEKEPQIRFIILSGHDDFQYAQTALKLGADNYLLKPAGNPEIIAAVLGVVERIKANREDKYNQELLQRKWREHLPSLQSGFLQQWMNGRYADWEVERHARELMLEQLIHQGRAFIVAAVAIDPLSNSDIRFTDKDSFLLQFSLHSIAREYLPESKCLVFKDDNGSTIILFWGAEEEGEEELLFQSNSHVVKLLEVVKDCLKVTASAGTGLPITRRDVPVSFRQAIRALHERVLYGYNIVIPFTNNTSPNENIPLFDMDLERQIQLALETRDGPKALELIHLWYRDKCEASPSVEALQEQILFMQSLLIKVIHAQGWSVLEVVREEFAFFQRPDAIAGKKQIVEGVEKIIHKFLSFAEEQRSFKSNHFVTQLMEIAEQSMDQDISLHTIAGQLFVHPSYLSRLFKKGTGKTFSTYIQERKMQRAKEFLQEGAKVYEASQRVGYRDISYFTKLFRKYWGITPSDVARDR
jgi:two-component system response regulator YesN